MYGLLVIETVQTAMTFYYTYILAVLVVNGSTLVELYLRSPPLVRVQTFSEVSVYLLGGTSKSSSLVRMLRLIISPQLHAQSNYSIVTELAFFHDLGLLQQQLDR